MTKREHIPQANTTANKEKKYSRIPNPYHPYDIESGIRFYRKDASEKIKQLLSRPANHKLIVIQGYSGSGKTSTLRKMTDDPTILGDRFIPIYLRIDPTETTNLERFLLFVHQTLQKTLENNGVNLEGLRISNISLHGLAQVLNRAEFKPINDGSSKNFVLIFDDFEKIHRSPLASKHLPDFIQILRLLASPKNNFSLILAGAGEIFEWAQETGLKSYLSTDAKIDLETSMDDEFFESLIIDPVKGHTRYTPAAIDLIKEITGRNLYCQQLLCFYIIKVLNAIKKNTCGKSEVHQAIADTIDDKREDFVYFWENIPPEGQILSAALTDDQVVKKEGIYYFIKEKTPLNYLFDPDERYAILKRLTADRYINRIRGRRFEGTPYKVPLYGEWVKKHHSFPNTLANNWGFITSKLTLANLGKVLVTIPQQLLPIDRHKRKNALDLSNAWLTLKDTARGYQHDQQKSAAILELLSKFLDFTIIDHPGENRSFFLVDARSLNLSGFDEVRFFFLPDEDLGPPDTKNIQDEIQGDFSKSSFFSFLVCAKETETISELSRKEYLGTIIITEENLGNIILSPRPITAFKEEILIPQVKPSRISAYRTYGPATTTFYGRHDELGKILGTEKKNFALVGARKIGKTSLLKQVAKKLAPHTEPVYMDLESPRDQDYHTFLRSLENKLAGIHGHLQASGDNMEAQQAADEPEALARMSDFVIRLCRQTGKSIVLLLDEIDSLLKFDKQHDYRMIGAFRALYQEGYCQFILSGFEQLSQAADDLNSPLYNFCEFVHLGKLKEDDALALVTEPMEAVGVTYDDLKDRETILDYTSRHPNLLQFFCKKLIEKVEHHPKAKNPRSIVKEDIQDIYASFDYESYVLNEFYLFDTANVTPIERLIVLTRLEKYPEVHIFSSNDIHQDLRQCGIDLETGKLTSYLRVLRLRYIFEAVSGGRYCFALPAFPDLLKNRGDLESYIHKEIEHARKSL